jgi:hypothetical protein
VSYKVLDIYRDLPRTNTGDCGRANCFAFASAVYLDGAPLSDCPHLSPEKRAEMEAKLAEGRSRGEGRKPGAIRQAWDAVEREVSAMDFAQVAERCGAVYLAGDREALELRLIDQVMRIVRTGPGALDVEAVTAEAPSPAVRVLLLLYAGRSKGTQPAREWASPRELTVTRTKAAEFDEAAQRIADRFGGRLGDLDEAVRSLGGERTELEVGSADRAYIIPALPRVELLLLVWEAADEFPPRASFLVDRSLPDHLEPEPGSFVAQLVAERLVGPPHASHRAGN